MKHKNEVKKEFSHPIRINFFAASSISILILSMIYRNTIDPLAQIFFIVGAVFHIFFTFYTIKFWINNNLEMQHSNPAWFIPIVGNLIVPIAGKGFVSDEILYFYFSIGIFLVSGLYHINDHISSAFTWPLDFNHSATPCASPLLYLLANW